MASGVKFSTRLEISDLNYPEIHVHIAHNSHFHGLDHCSLVTASEVRSDLRIELSDLNYLCWHVCLPSIIQECSMEDTNYNSLTSVFF